MRNFDIHAFSKRLAEIRQRARDPRVVRDCLQRVGEAWAEECNLRAPVARSQPSATGTPPGRRLKGSIVFMVTADRHGYLVIPNPGRYVIYATRPHFIQPKAARLAASGGRARLRFAAAGVGGGRMVYARRVRHPGTRANPFVEEAWASARVRDAKRWAAVHIVRGAS